MSDQNPGVESHLAALRALPRGLGPEPTWTVAISTRRRHLGMTLEAHGGLTVRVPVGTDASEVARWVEAQRGWWAPKVAERARSGPAHKVAELVPGEEFRWLGRRYRLTVTGDPASSAVAAVDARGEITLPDGRQEGQLRVRRDVLSPDTIIDWYRREGHRHVVAVAHKFAYWPGFDRVQRWDVTDLSAGRKRWLWGQWYPKTGRVAVHWAAFQFDPDTVEYLIAHELAHVATEQECASHGPDWRARMALWRGDWERLQDNLAAVGRSSWLGEVAPTPT
jgi:predicted metal-dependent hydrolase